MFIIRNKTNASNDIFSIYYLVLVSCVLIIEVSHFDTSFKSNLSISAVSLCFTEKMSADLQARLLAEFDEIISDDSDVSSIDEEPQYVQEIRGFRKNSKVIWDPLEQNLYYKNVWNEKANGTACTCYDEKCTKRIYINEDGLVISSLSSHNINHGSMYETYKHMYCFNLMKDRCLTAPACMSVREIYDEVVLE